MVTAAALPGAPGGSLASTGVDAASAAPALAGVLGALLLGAGALIWRSGRRSRA
jgi:LPXTG-motif cell wall-anchored protein